jgi:nicotinate-nucleotide adenylyltransferase
MAKDRIGLFGGTFNPVHSGHLHAAQRVRARFGLREVLFIPSFIPPHKETRDIAPAADRLEMVWLAVRGLPGLTACTVEVEARQTSYTVLTLDTMKNRYPGAWLFFVLGTDAFLEIETWRDHRHLLEECHWIVMTRPGWPRDRVAAALGDFHGKRSHLLAESETPDEDLFGRARIIFMDVDALDISSSAIREAVRSGRPLGDLVPAAVEAHIRSRHLYQKDNG